MTMPGMPMTPGTNGSMTMPGMPMTPGTNGSMTMPGMPMTPGTNGSMTMPGMPMAPGTNGSMTMPGMPMTPGTNGSMTMPDMNYPEYMQNYMYMPGATPYTAPMGIPLLPLYGYDNSADIDHDIQYLRQLYPNVAKRVQREIDNECDKYEYDGSAMFDEYPDRLFLERIVDQIYDRIKENEDETQVEMQGFYGYPSRRRQSYLRDIVTLLLLGELTNRRRRYRGRRRWF
jgi:hypothetical protein